MRVLGVTPSSNDVTWALVEGTRTTPVIIPVESSKQKFPKTQDESQILHNLYKFALSFLRDQAVDKELQGLHINRDKKILAYE